MASGPSGRKSLIGMWTHAAGLVMAAAGFVMAVAGPARAQPRVIPAELSGSGDSVSGPLIISTPVSMAAAMRQMAAAFVMEHPRVIPEVRVGPSVSAARALADSTEIPDVFVSADDTLIDAMLVPRYAAWSAGFARTALVLAYTESSKYADEINTRNWTDVLSKPDVHGARGNPDEDPSAYRALLFFQLAARFYLRPRLARALEQAMPVTDFGLDERSLEARFADGTIDYMPIYRSTAAEHELEWLELPAPINLGDTAFAASYAAATVRVPRRASDTLTIYGAPILYGLTVPRAAPHPALALAFARFSLSPAGRDLVRNSGFDPADRPVLHGTPPAGLDAEPAP